MVDSEVRSFTGGVPAAVGMTYRFERLPSQREGEETRNRIETQATQALQRAGLVHNDSNALGWSTTTATRATRYRLW